MSDDKVCPLCKRILGDINVDFHHLIPKTFKGKEGVDMHRVCHRVIHATFSERELYNYYHTIDRLLEHEKIQKFVKWIQKKEPAYYVSTDESHERKKKRRR